MNIILTGSTGMVGKGVLLECLDSPAIQKVLAINRSTLNMDHPKLQEVLLPDFSRLEEIREQLAGYDACFHCMGVSALGLSEAEYTHITYTYTRYWPICCTNSTPKWYSFMCRGPVPTALSRAGACGHA